MRLKIVLVFGLLVLSSAVATAQEMEVDPDPKGYASGVSGQVLVLEPDAAEPKPLADSDPVFEGSRITAAENSFAEIDLVDGSEIKIDEMTQMDVDHAQISSEDDAEPERRIGLSMLYGALRISVPVGFSKTSAFKITTPVSVTGVRGTDFAVEYESENASTVDVFDGEVAVAQEGAVETLGAQESATAERGRGVTKSALQEQRKERWESFKEAMNLHGAGQAEARLKEKIERIRAGDPNDPRLAGLETALENVSTRRGVARSRLEAAREKMKDRRQDRLDRMREFAKKHGRERFEQARKFRGGALTPEQRQAAGEKLRERRKNVREKAAQRHRERRDNLKDRRDERKDDLKQRREEKRENMQERRGQKRDDIQNRREQRRENKPERRERPKERRRR